MFQSKYLFTMAAASALLVPAYVVTVDAATQDVADGTYEVNFLTYKTGTTETSGMANRFAQPAKLVVENGEATLVIDIVTQNSMLGNLMIPYKGESVSMTTLKGNLTTETRTVSLPIEKFGEAITVDVDVVFPGSNTPVRQTFDIIVETPEADDLYEEVTMTAYEYGTTKKIDTANFIAPKVKVQPEGDHYLVHIYVTNNSVLQKLEINGEVLTPTTTEGQNATYVVNVKNMKQLVEANATLNFGGLTVTQKAHLHFAVKGAPLMIDNPFSDIDNNANKDAILNLYNKGIVTKAEKFNPGNSLTRSQFALMIARTLKLDAAPDAGFKDIAALKTKDVERYNAINALAKAGIVKKQAKFNSNATLTRQQAALMIYRAMQYHVGTDALDFGNNITVYADGNKVKDEEAQRALSFLYAGNAMTGSIEADGKRYIKPNAPLTRGQMAKVLNGTLKYLGH